MKVEIGEYKDPSGKRDISIEVTHSDVFSLDDTLAHVIYACLVKYKKYQKKHPGHPACLTMDNWIEILDIMIKTFKDIKDGKRYEASKKELEEIQDGVDLFAKYYTHLWL